MSLAVGVAAGSRSEHAVRVEHPDPGEGAPGSWRRNAPRLRARPNSADSASGGKCEAGGRSLPVPPGDRGGLAVGVRTVAALTGGDGSWTVTYGPRDDLRHTYAAFWASKG